MANTILDTQAAANATKARSGKDGALYNAKGKLIASVESFQTKMSLSNTKYQPIGTPQEFEVNTAFGTTLSFTQILVEDDAFIDDLLAYQSTGVVPQWSFQGVIKGTKKEQRYIYPNCIPSGDIDLQNVQSGDVIKRAWSLYCNGKVTAQGKLK